MKQPFLVLLLSFLMLKSFSQDTIYLKNIDDTLSVTKEKAIYYKVIDSKVNPIEVITYYTNGIKVSIEHLSSLSPKIKDGEYVSYFYDGKISIKGTFVNDKMEGSWIAYNKEKGFIESKLNFKENLKNGKGFTFYENGKLSRMDVFIRDTLGLSTCYDSIGIVIECPVNINSEEKEVMPSFPGGVSALMKYLTSSVKLANVTKNNNNIDGKVIVKFYIDKDGTTREPVVLKNNTGILECEKEALSIVLSMPKWIPGTQKGKPVKVYYTLPVNFTINR